MTIKRPLLLLTGGFVLGEVLILQGSVVTELLPAAALAALCCVLVRSAAAAWRGRQQGILLQKNHFQWRRWKGRSLWLRLLPLFVCAGMLRAQQVKGQCEKEILLGLDGETAEVQGRVSGVSEKGEWVILTLEDGTVRTVHGGEAGGKLKRIQVYVEAEDVMKDSDADSAAMADSAEESRSMTVRDAGDGRRAPRIGSQVRVSGECSEFEPARNPGGFDYRMYYRSLKLNYRMFAFAYEVMDADSGSLWDRYRDSLCRLSMWAADRLQVLVGEEDAGIFRAVLLGDKSGLSENIRDMYQKNGIAHLLAVSGLHLSLVSLAAYGLFRRLGAGYGTAGLAGGAVLLSFALMTGASPSVVRALIMALCGFLAAYLGRTYDLLSALGLSALWLLWDSPYLLFQAGVQLSFGAIIGIGGLAACLRKRYKSRRDVDGAGERGGTGSSGRAGERGGTGSSARAGKGEETGSSARAGKMEQAFFMSISMQLATLPLILFHFFQYPLYSIFLNLLVVPLMGIVLASGTAGITLGSLSLSAGRFAAGSGCAVLGWYEWCCGMFERLPGSSVILGRPEFWQIGVYYGILAVAAWPVGGSCEVRGSKMRGSEARGNEVHGSVVEDICCTDVGNGAEGGTGAGIFLVLLSLIVVLLPIPVHGLEVTFLDVGQGDGICLRTGRAASAMAEAENGRGFHELLGMRPAVIMVDGGSTDEKNLGEARLEPFLKSRGIRTVDYWVVSHGDQDHISGLVWMLEKSGDIAIQNLVLPAAGYGNKAYDRLVELAGQRGVTVSWMEQSDSFLLGRLRFTCIYPEETKEAPLPESADRNEHSLTLRADYSGFHMLLTGDMSGEGEKRLMKLLEDRITGDGIAEDGITGDEKAENKTADGGLVAPGLGNIQVLKVAHHGSRFSSTEDWLAAVRPAWAVVSYGEDNRYGHPHRETMERFEAQGIPVFKTAECGAVILETDGKKIIWHTYR